MAMSRIEQNSEPHMVRLRDGEWGLYGTIDKSFEIDLNEYKVFVWERLMREIILYKKAFPSSEEKVYYDTFKGRRYDIRKLKRIFEETGLFSHKTEGCGFFKKHIWVRTKCRLDLNK